MAVFQSPKNYSSEAEISRKMPEIPQKERFFAKFQAPKFASTEPEKNAIPYPQLFHTPTRLPPTIVSQNSPKIVKVGTSFGNCNHC